MRQRHRLPGRDADKAEVEDGGLVDVELADARAGRKEDHVAHHQAKPDGDQRRRDQAAAGQRLQDREMKRQRQQRRRRHRAERGDHQILAVDRVQQEGGIGGESQVFAMREVGDALDAEDQRRAHAGQRQDRAGDQPVDGQLCELLEHDPRWILAAASGDPGRRCGPGSQVYSGL